MTPVPQLDWLTVFLDFPTAEFGPGAAFWRDATGYALSASRGAANEFASLVPAHGHEYLRVQRLQTGSTRLHLDLHVDDPYAAAESAEQLGADLVDESEHGYFVLRSPAGIVFCLLRHPGSVVPAARQWPDDHSSRVVEVCLDAPPAAFEAESAFWQAMAPGAWLPDADDTVRRPGGALAVALRLQRNQLGTGAGAHLHIGTDDLGAEVDRLVALGARTRLVRPRRTVLEAPGGTAFCVVEAAGELR